MLSISQLTKTASLNEYSESYLRGYEYINSWQRPLVVSITGQESLRAIKERFITQYLKAFPSAQGLLYQDLVKQASTCAINAWTYARASHLYAEQLWLALNPKTHYMVPLDSTVLGLQGVIDEIRYLPDEAFLVLKKKQYAPAQGVHDEHAIQAGAFILLWNACMGIKVRQAIIAYADDERYVSLTPLLKDRVLRIRDEIFLSAKSSAGYESLPLTTQQTNTFKY